MNNQAIQTQTITTPNTLTSTVQDLSSSLSALAPQNSETTQMITYVLVGTVIAGLLVYHYIKSQEDGAPLRINLNLTPAN